MKEYLERLQKFIKDNQAALIKMGSAIGGAIIGGIAAGMLMNASEEESMLDYLIDDETEENNFMDEVAA